MSGYAPIARIGDYSVVRATSGRLYAAWYDAFARQVRRRALHTDDIARACEIVTRLVDRGISGDPHTKLATRHLSTVADLLAWHDKNLKSLPSIEIERLHGRLIASEIGTLRLAALSPGQIDQLRDKWRAEGAAIATVSRRLSTLRSAIKRAVRDKELPPYTAPFIPEYRKRAQIRSSPPKGRICTCAEIAALYDAALEPHLRIYLAYLIGTLSRAGAVLELTPGQIRPAEGRIFLDPPGREQTAKYRPVLPMVEFLNNWCPPTDAARAIMWRGRAVNSVKTGIRRAVARAGLPPNVNSYSLRHSGARFLREHSVPLEEIAVWLGHIAPPNSPETTLIYSPHSPDYLNDALGAMNVFAEAIASCAKTPLLHPPKDVAAYFVLCERWSRESKVKA